MEITEFVRKNDFIPKLYAAIEHLDQGKAHGVFEGLQEGKSAVVEISYDGVNVHLKSYVCRIPMMDAVLVPVKAEEPKKTEPKTEKEAEKGKKTRK
jgi:hypothetical protein